MLVGVDFPTLADRTALLSHGAPHAVTVGGDGARVLFLRSAGPADDASALWALTVATGEERLVADPARLIDDAPVPAPGGIAAYAADTAARIVAFPYAGRLFRADLVAGEVVEVATEDTVTDPRPDPAGHRIAYVTPGAALRVVEPDGTDVLLAGEPGVRWGAADPVAASAFGRTRGYWWAPDGLAVLAARAGRDRVSLHLLDLDGGWVDVHWDRETYPYLVDVRWADGGPLITVLRRLQQHGLVLSVDPRTGETQVHAELADARWVEPVAGTPRYLPDGRVLVGGELAHDGYDARCLFADGSLLTPPALYVRRVVGVLPRLNAPAGGPDLILEAAESEPGEQHVYRVRTALVSGAAEATRLTTGPGRHVAEVGGDVLVLGSSTLDTDGVRWSVHRADRVVGTLASHAGRSAAEPRPALTTVTDRRLPAGVVYPSDHLAGRRLPVLLDLGGGPGTRHVEATRTAWLGRQWWADAGWAVVSLDPRGTPGAAPSYEKIVHRRLADVTLADHCDGLRALVGKHPDLDLGRVAVRGTGLGGWLAVLAALTRPELFRCATARNPVVDWTDLPAAVAERYLGPADDAPAGGDVYARHNLREAVHPADDARPLLIVQGTVDGALPAAVLRLSAALLEAAHPHAVLPVPDATDLAAGHESQVLPQELDFVRRHLT
jgi:dipeptidyl-peptidase-4